MLKTLWGKDSVQSFKHYALLMKQIVPMMTLKAKIIEVEYQKKTVLRDLDECMGKIKVTNNELRKDPTRNFTGSKKKKIKRKDMQGQITLSKKERHYQFLFNTDAGNCNVIFGSDLLKGFVSPFSDEDVRGIQNLEQKAEFETTPESCSSYHGQYVYHDYQTYGRRATAFHRKQYPAGC